VSPQRHPHTSHRGAQQSSREAHDSTRTIAPRWRAAVPTSDCLPCCPVGFRRRSRASVLLGGRHCSMHLPVRGPLRQAIKMVRKRRLPAEWSTDSSRAAKERCGRHLLRRLITSATPLYQKGGKNSVPKRGMTCFVAFNTTRVPTRTLDSIVAHHISQNGGSASPDASFVLPEAHSHRLVNRGVTARCDRVKTHGVLHTDRELRHGLMR